VFFQIEVATPPNTPASAPVVARLAVYPGVTRQVWVGFPRGCYGLAHMQIWHWGWQLWPWTPQTSYHWNDYMFTFEDRYPILEEPLELVVKSWNLDDSFEHTLTFAVTVEPAPSEEEIRELRERLLALGLIREG